MFPCHEPCMDLKKIQKYSFWSCTKNKSIRSVLLHNMCKSPRGSDELNRALWPCIVWCHRACDFFSGKILIFNWYECLALRKFIVQSYFLWRCFVYSLLGRFNVHCICHHLFTFIFAISLQVNNLTVWPFLSEFQMLLLDLLYIALARLI